MTLERAFYQYEVLLVDEKVPLTAGKFLVDTILDTTFGHPVTTRMRTGFFPFVAEFVKSSETSGHLRALW